MKSELLATLLFIFLSLFNNAYAEEELLPNPEEWQEAFANTEEAIKNKDSDAIISGMNVVFSQALFFDPLDKRLPESTRLLLNSTRRLESISRNDRSFVTNWLSSLLNHAREHNLLDKPVSTFAMNVYTSRLVSSGQIELAKKEAADLIEYVTNKAGPTDTAAIEARKSEIRVLVASYDNEAVELRLKSLSADIERFLGKDHVEYFRVLEFTGDNYFDIGQFEKSETVLREAIKLAGSMTDRSEQNLAAYLEVSLADQLSNLWRWKDSFDLYSDAVKRYRENNLGNRANQRTDTNFANALLGQVHTSFNMGDIKSAEILAKHLLSLVDSLNVNKTQILASIYLAMAEIYSVAGDTSQTDTLLRQFLSLSEQSESNVGNFNKIDAAYLLTRSGYTQEALDLLNPLASIPGGDNSNNKAAVLAALAYTYLHVDDTKPISEEIEQAIDIYTKNHRAGTTQYSNALAVLAATRFKQGQNNEALQLYEQISNNLDIKSHSIPLSNILEEYMLVLNETGDSDKAEEIRTILDTHKNLIATSVHKSEQYTVEEKNFSFTQPDTVWAEVEIEGSTAGEFTFSHYRTGIYAAIIAKPNSYDVNGMVDDQIKLMENKSQVLEIERRNRTVNNIDGVELHYTATDGRGKRERHISWSAKHNKLGYQVIVSGNVGSASKEEMYAYLSGFLSNFALLNYDKIDNDNRDMLVDNKSLGYKVDLSNEPWYRIENPVPNKLADFGAFIGREDGAFYVITFPFFNDVDEQAISDVLGSLTLGKETHRQPWSNEHFHGFDFESENNSAEANIKNFGRVAIGEKAGYLLISTVDGRRPHLDPMAKEVLDKVTLYPDIELKSYKDLPEAGKEAQGLLAYQIGLWYHKRSSLQRSEEWFSTAYSLLPENEGILADLAYLQLMNGNVTGSAATLNQDLEGKSNKAVLFGLRAVARSRMNDFENAIADFESALQHGNKDEELPLAYINALVTAGKNKEALNFIDERFGSSTLSESMILTRARVEANMGETESALKTLKDIEAATLTDPSLAALAAQIYFESGEFESLLGFAQKAKSTGAKSLDLYLLEAQAFYETGDYENTRQALEETLQFSPGDARATQFLADINYILGSGNTTLIREAVQPVIIPDSLAATPSNDIPDGAEDMGGYYEFHHEAIEYIENESYRRTFHQKAVALNRNGVDRLKTLLFKFDPAFERIYVNELIVRDADGKIVSEGDINSYFVSDSSEHDSATSKKILNVPVKGLRLSYSVEVTVSREIKEKSGYFIYFDKVLTQELPVISGIFYVTGDLENLLFSSENVEAVKHDNAILWKTGELAAIDPQPFLTPNILELHRVRVGDKRQTWPDLAKGYSEELVKFEEQSNELDQLASEITADLGSDYDKAIALADYVQKQLTYRAIEFGRRAMIPNSIASIQQNGFGDCKDHSLLLHNLLASAGIESQLVLVNSRDLVDSKVPSLDQFDHMIVYCKSCSESGVYFDTTDKYSSLGSDVPRNLAGKTVLSIDHDQSRLMEIGQYDPDYHKASLNRQITITAEGDLVVDEQITFKGYMADHFRDVFASLGRNRWNDGIQYSVYNQVRGARLNNIEVTGLETNQELVLDLQYQISSGIAIIEDQMVGKLPAIWEQWLLSASPVENRKQAFELEYPLQIQSAVTVKFPGGINLATKSNSSRYSSKYLDWESTEAPDSDGFSQQITITRHADKFAASEYGDFVTTTENVFKVLEPALTANIRGDTVQ